ncbi:hypothetical protein MLD38_038338 [Melastoma candidum]|uniref:Uncharacterized protein n=1 Tax=Melastoma candidum TaxID=119954 RepID=A0ACB9KZF8_9MYRT|nr:hypothetical protein MLD38_038338 [Melastoma candidum]
MATLVASCFSVDGRARGCWSMASLRSSLPSYPPSFVGLPPSSSTRSLRGLSARLPRMLKVGSFVGLSPLNRILSFGSDGEV